MEVVSQFPRERAQAALDALPSDAPDDVIAAAIADVLLAEAPARSLFKLGIQFDARNAPCPVPVDKASREWCTITHRDKAEAREWLIKAALTGCTVARIMQLFSGSELHSESIRHIRDRTHYRQTRAAMTPQQRQELDDEIPF